MATSIGLALPNPYPYGLPGVQQCHLRVGLATYHPLAYIPPIYREIKMDRSVICVADLGGKGVGEYIIEVLSFLRGYNNN